jgi:hypothetical protein
MKADQLIRTIEIKDRNGRVVGTKEVVTYQGLLSKAHEEGLARVETALVQVPSDENGRTAIAKVVIETAKGRFEAIGDASPDNVNSFIIPHLIRMAETRAKARALRDAVNVGILSFEELDGEDSLPNGRDLGSGAPALGVPVTRTSRPAPQPSEPQGNGAGVPMTDAQRRYLFRILAGRRMPSERAHAYLKEFFGVESLEEVTKLQATHGIDELLKEVTDGARER